MMIRNGVVKRNLPEQVEKNKNDIEEIITDISELINDVEDLEKNKVNYTDLATADDYGLVKLYSDAVNPVLPQGTYAVADRTYGVQKNSSGQLVVNVPWSAGSADLPTRIYNNGLKITNATDLANQYYVPFAGVGQAGAISTDAQTITGNKTLTGNTTLTGSLTTNSGISSNGNITINSLSGSNLVFDESYDTTVSKWVYQGANIIHDMGTSYTSISLPATSGTLALTSQIPDININSTVQTVAARSLWSTSDRSYFVQKDTNGYLCVNVPWNGDVVKHFVYLQYSSYNLGRTINLKIELIDKRKANYTDLSQLLQVLNTHEVTPFVANFNDEYSYTQLDQGEVQLTGFISGMDTQKLYMTIFSVDDNVIYNESVSFIVPPQITMIANYYKALST